MKEISRINGYMNILMQASTLSSKIKEYPFRKEGNAKSKKLSTIDILLLTQGYGQLKLYRVFCQWARS